MKNITFDCANVDSSVIGNDHGIELSKVMDEYKSTIAQAVSEIWRDKDGEGNWLKWMNLGENAELAQSINEYAASVKGKFDNLVILGIGGSSLGGLAITEALLAPYWNTLSEEQRNGYPKIFFLDNIDPDQIEGLKKAVDLKKTLFNVISKSGTTAETMSQYIYFHNLLKQELGESYKENIVATTDANKGILREIATAEGYQTFEVPDDVGGRFSVFSAVGMLPFALVGIDICQLQEGIKAIMPMMQDTDLSKNMAALNALIHYVMDTQKAKNQCVFMPYSSRLRLVSDWFVQLWAESLGKGENLNGETINVGQTPIKALGATDQHSQIQLYNEGPNNKLINFVRVGKFDTTVTIPDTYSNVEALAYMSNKTINDLINAEADATKMTLAGYKRPNVSITIPEVNAFYLAQLLYMLEVQTAVAGKLYNIDAFNQPGVEQAKKYTNALMGKKGMEEMAEELKKKMKQPSFA